ncbi:hypothetical protein FACS1894218_6240 [Bacilli bacterium]|nr:hypothetical protein FACS1894218_6240 [Bacilli bacterium]
MSQKITSFSEIQGNFDKKITINRDQSQELFIVDIGAKNSSILLNLTLKERSKVNVYIYSLNSNTNRTINVTIKQTSNSVSNVHIKCINANHGYTDISILGDAAEHALNIQLNQQVEGILLDDLSTIKVLPSMLVDTNRIKASHAVNIGNINPEQLFYLMSRGVPKHAATTILLESMFSRIKDAQSPIYSDIKLKLNQMLGVK